MENLTRKLYKLNSQQERLDSRIKRLNGIKRQSQEVQMLMFNRFAISLDIANLNK
jgi:division protein CdvB (Snf7/Vps24/ESCRT-III family)